MTCHPRMLAVPQGMRGRPRGAQSGPAPAGRSVLDRLLGGAAAEAGILSGSPGLEYFDPPSPPSGFLKVPVDVDKIQATQKKRYQDFDENFKKSPLLQGLLQKSKENAAKNKQIIEDKYCERGAEWGVGDCSLNGLPAEAKEAFRARLAQSKAATSQ
eukprot:SM001017S09158  [mRNA]  locus=s1017:641:2062:- [translate_table: standard]